MTNKKDLIRIVIELKDLTREELAKVLFEAFSISNKYIDLSNLDFSQFNCSVDLSGVKVNGDLYQNNQYVIGDLYQSGHEVQGNLTQCFNHVDGDLIQGASIINGNLIQKDNNLNGQIH